MQVVSPTQVQFNPQVVHVVALFKPVPGVGV